MKECIVTTKKCSRCGEIKPIECFHKDTTRLDGVRYWCKQCVYIGNKLYDNLHINENRKRGRKHYTENRERASIRCHKYYERNKQVMLDHNRKWKMENKDRVKELQKVAYKKQSKDPKFILRNRMRRRIWNALKGQKNGRHWEDLVGYTLIRLKNHLEKQFTDGMTWDNYGKWHIDHIIPISAFNFTKPEHVDFKKCWALKNLRPLWALENWSKNARLDQPFQPSFAFDEQIRMEA